MQQKLASNTTLFFVIINAMLGGGVFINLKNLTVLAGSWGFAAYLVGYLLYLPIIYSLATLAQTKSVAGGIYHHIRENLSSALAALAALSYFLAKTVSVAVMVRAMVQMVQAAGAPGPGWLYEVTFLAGMAALNIAGVSIVGFIQVLFSLFKVLPIALIIGFGICCLTPVHFNWSADFFMAAGNVWQALPLALFAMSSFEIVLHIGHLVAKPQSLRRVLLAATSTVAALYALFHFIIFAQSGSALANLTWPLTQFAQFISTSPAMQLSLNFLVFIAIFACAYSLLSSNPWNLQALAQDYGSAWLSQVNAQGSPWVAVSTLSIIALILLNTFSGFMLLQNFSVLATTLTYLFCTLAALRWFMKHDFSKAFIPTLALGSCVVICGMVVSKLF